MIMTFCIAILLTSQDIFRLRWFLTGQGDLCDTE